MSFLLGGPIFRELLSGRVYFLGCAETAPFPSFLVTRIFGIFSRGIPINLYLPQWLARELDPVYKLKPTAGRFGTVRSKFICQTFLGGTKRIWSNHSYLTRPISPTWWFSKGLPLISGKSRLVKYYNLSRKNGFQNWFEFTETVLGGFSGLKFQPDWRIQVWRIDRNLEDLHPVISVLNF